MVITGTRALTTDGKIDHLFPASKGGSHNLSDLQPLQQDNNRRKECERLVVLRKMNFAGSGSFDMPSKSSD
jgi:hypothetical protein